MAMASAISKASLERLPYLAALGVDALWLSPIFASPMADFGYDISDYLAVDPLFGTMRDFDALLAAAHARGLKVLLDLVPNHTSDQHPWFIASRASRANPKRDWYIWREGGPGGGPPNNWLSVFGGSAWTFDEPSGQYYYHAFLKEQPDLNWRNPRRARGDARGHALLAQARRRRLPRRCDLASDQGRSTSATIRPIRSFARAMRTTDACCRFIPPTGLRCTR